jgi:hypothetical protein
MGQHIFVDLKWEIKLDYHSLAKKIALPGWLSSTVGVYMKTSIAS